MKSGKVAATVEAHVTTPASWLQALFEEELRHAGPVRVVLQGSGLRDVWARESALPCQMAACCKTFLPCRRWSPCWRSCIGVLVRRVLALWMHSVASSDVCFLHPHFARHHHDDFRHALKAHLRLCWLICTWDPKRPEQLTSQHLLACFAQDKGGQLPMTRSRGGALSFETGGTYATL